MQQTLTAELEALSEAVNAAQATRDTAQAELTRLNRVVAKGAATQAELDKVEQTLQRDAALLSQAQADLDARRAQGTLSAEQELARRARDLAAERAALTLLQAGTRPQELAAAQSRIDRLKAELEQLQKQQRRREVRSRIAGVVVTPRLREKIGSSIQEGETVCVVENRSFFEAEITLTEEKIAHLKRGLEVELKARALPYATLTGRVTRIATSAAEDDDKAQSTLAVHCRLIDTPATLRTSLTGHARIYTGRRPVGVILLDRALRLLRTEWWW
jgi:multidrug resistance efflux pump